MEKTIKTIIFFTAVVMLLSCKKTREPFEVVEGVLPSDTVWVIAVDRQGVKWFGTPGGLVQYDNEGWRTYTAGDPLASAYVYDLALQSTSYGREVWVAAGSGVTACGYDVDGISGATTYHSGNAPLGDTVVAVAVDTGGVSWFGTNRGITVFYDHGIWQSLDYQTAGHRPVVCIAGDAAGWNYMGTCGSGVARYTYNRVDGITGASLYQQPWSPLPSQNILSVFVTKNGDQWYGTDRGAAFHQGKNAKSGWVIYADGEGLPDNRVLAIFQDSDGDVWFGTPKGLSRFNGITWNTFTTKEGLAGEVVYSIARDTDGSLWIGTDHGLSHWQVGQKTIYRK